MIDFDVRASARGPVFDSRGPRYAARGASEGAYRVAVFARNQIAAFLGARFKAPTGHYLSTLNVVRSGMGWEVDGNGTAYGKWLEGTDPRQLSGQVRWKGYRAFRTIERRVRTRAAAIALPAVMPWIRRIGGS